MKLYFAGPLFTTPERKAFSFKKWIVLVRTDMRTLAGSAGDDNSMLTEAATIRIDLPAASTVQVIAMILGAIARIETGSV